MSPRTLLDRILEPGCFSVLFQPIVGIAPDGMISIRALEGLVRGPRGTNIESPAIIFEYVRRKGEESAVDRLCAAAILKEAASLPHAVQVTINVHASTLERDRGTARFIKEEASRNEISPSRLILEIVEHRPVRDSVRFLESLDELRDAGVRIALDDLGLGHSNYAMILSARPDLLKLDRSIVRDSNRDLYRQAIIESIALIATRTGTGIVAEGIENEDDLNLLRDLGITLFQGFYFRPPLPLRELVGLLETSIDPFFTGSPGRDQAGGSSIRFRR